MMTAVAHLDLCHLEAFRYAYTVAIIGIVGVAVFVGKNTSTDFGIYSFDQRIVHDVLQSEKYGSRVANWNLREL